MSIGIIVDFEFKPGGAESTIEIMKARLPFTRSQEGCEMIELYVDHDNANRLILVERWASRAHYDQYLKWAKAQPDTQRFRQSFARDAIVGVCALVAGAFLFAPNVSCEKAKKSMGSLISLIDGTAQKKMDPCHCRSPARCRFSATGGGTFPPWPRSWRSAGRLGWPRPDR